MHDLARSMHAQAVLGIERALRSRDSAMRGLEQARKPPASERFWKRLS